MRAFKSVRVLFSSSSPRRRTPVVLQDAPTECGAACLAMVLGAHGRSTPVRELREELDIGRDGAAVEAMVRAARARGMDVEVYQSEPESLVGLSGPLIAHWKLGHFVVVERVTREHARIIDPATGRSVMRREEFDRSFTGIVMSLIPAEHFEPRPPARGETARFLFRFLPRDPELLGTILAVSTLIALVGVVPALLTRYLIDHVISVGDTGLLTVLGLGIIVLAMTVLAGGALAGADAGPVGQAGVLAALAVAEQRVALGVHADQRQQARVDERAHPRLVLEDVDLPAAGGEGDGACGQELAGHRHHGVGMQRGRAVHRVFHAVVPSDLDVWQ